MPLDRHGVLLRSLQHLGRLTAATLCAVVILTPGPAPGFTALPADGADRSAKAAFERFDLTYRQNNSSPPPVYDACLSHLRQNDAHASDALSGDDRRAAGTAAAVGLIIGARFAITPTYSSAAPRLNMAPAQADLRFTNGVRARTPHARAIANYRHCKKGEALKALNAFRWAR